MTDLADAFAAWADWATSVLADWPDDPADAEPDTGHLRSDRPTRNHHAEQSPVQGAAQRRGVRRIPEARRVGDRRKAAEELADTLPGAPQAKVFAEKQEGRPAAIGWRVVQVADADIPDSSQAAYASSEPRRLHRGYFEALSCNHSEARQRRRPDQARALP